MLRYLPGTTIETNLAKNEAKKILDNIFSTGGLVLSQVSQLAGVEPYTVQNWVKRGFLKPPISKKYTREQFCRIITINMLKDCLHINEVARLLRYVNGNLRDDSDDVIDDDELYLMLVDVLRRIDSFSEDVALASIEKTLDGYVEKTVGVSRRLEKALMIMTCAYFSAQYSKKATVYLGTLE